MPFREQHGARGRAGCLWARAGHGVCASVPLRAASRGGHVATFWSCRMLGQAGVGCLMVALSAVTGCSGLLAATILGLTSSVVGGPGWGSGMGPLISPRMGGAHPGHMLGEKGGSEGRNSGQQAGLLSRVEGSLPGGDVS